MATKKQVIRDGLKILGPLGDGTGDPSLSRDAASLDVGLAQPVDAGTVLPRVLGDGKIWIGDASNTAQERQPVGMIGVTNLGNFTITPNVIMNSHINALAGISYTKLNLTNSIVNADVAVGANILRNKLATGTPYRVIVNNSTGVMSENAALTSDRAVISDANGLLLTSATTATEISYVNQVTSPIQQQLNNRLFFSSSITPSEGDLVLYTGGAWTNLSRGNDGQVLTSTASSIAWENGTSNGLPPGGSTAQYLAKIDGADYNAAWYTLTLDKITDVTATAAEVNILDGALITTIELNSLEDVTSNVQTQLNNKLFKSLAYNSLFVGSVANEAEMLAPGDEGDVLTIISGAPVWQPAGTGSGTVTGIAPTTDNAIVRWNGTLGDSIQNSGIIIDDSNNLTTPANVHIQNQFALRLYETGSTNYVGIRASGTMSADYTITLPAAAPATDTYLKWNGTNYVWDVASGGGGATEFTDLTDTFANYTGKSLQYLRVNVGMTGIESVAFPATTLTGDVTGTGVGSFATTIANNAVSNAKFRQSVGLSVVGRSANSTGNVADIAGTDGQVLRVAGTSLGFGAITVGAMSMNTARLLGRTTASTGAVEEIQVTNGLTYSSLFLKLGGTITENTTFAGAGFNWSSSNFANYNVAANDAINFGVSGGAVFSMEDDAVHTLQLGQSGGVIFNIGSDAAGDMYHHNTSGKFSRIPIGSSGQILITSDTGLPIWSNTITEDVSATTYLFTAADNGKHKRFTHASGCLATIPTGLPAGWSAIGARAPGAGVTTFASAGTLEAVATTLDNAPSAATIYHRGSNIHVLYGPLGVSGGGGGGSGTVTSVGLAMPSIFTVSSSPVTLSGTLTAALTNQTANLVFASPASGAAAAPTFRGLVLADLPNEVFEDVGTTTYLATTADNKKIKRFTNVSGATITIPTGLPIGWSFTVLRDTGAGPVTVVSAGVYEGVSNTLATPMTAAGVLHRGSNIHVGLGAFSSAGGSPLTTKGDIFVYSTTDVRLPVGTNGQVLKANSATTTGLEWGAAGSGTVTSVGLTLGTTGTDVNITSSPITTSGNITLNIPDAGATARGLVNTGSQTFAGAKTYSTAPIFSTMTPGSVLFAGASGVVAQDNANFFWNDTNNALGLGTVTTTSTGRIASLMTANSVTYGIVHTNTNTSTAGMAALSVANSSTVTNIEHSSTGLTASGPRFASQGALRSTGANGLVLWANGAAGVNNVVRFAIDSAVKGTWSSTGLGIGISPATAQLHLAAHTAAAGSAPIKLTSGTAMTTPENGSLEYHGSHLYFTIGSTRYQLDQQGGGGGITNSAAANEIPKSNGTNIVPSGVFSSIAGNLDLGTTSLSGTSRIITATTSAASTLLQFAVKGGSGQIYNSATGNAQWLVGATGTGMTLDYTHAGGYNEINAPAGLGVTSGAEIAITTGPSSDYVAFRNSGNAREIVINTTASDNRIDSAGDNLHIATNTGFVVVTATTDVGVVHGPANNVQFYNTANARQINLTTVGSFNTLSTVGSDLVLSSPSTYGIFLSSADDIGITSVNGLTIGSSAGTVLLNSAGIMSLTSGAAVLITADNGINLQTDDSTNIIIGDPSRSNQQIRLLANATNTSYIVTPYLPTSAAGLPSGAWWRDSGAGNVLKVVP